MKLGSPIHTNPFQCLSSVCGGLGRKGAQDERKEEQSEYSVSMAFSQGARPHNHSASHPVGRSQMRQRAPSSLIPERQTALKTEIPSQKTTLHSLLFAAISEVQPFLQITCACSAPKYRPWANSLKKIRSALWVNPTVIPSVCLGETARRYDEKALADSLTGRNGLKNGFLDRDFFFFRLKDTNNLEVCSRCGGQSRQTDFNIGPASGRSDPQTPVIPSPSARSGHLVPSYRAECLAR